MRAKGLLVTELRSTTWYHIGRKCQQNVRRCGEVRRGDDVGVLLGTGNCTDANGIVCSCVRVRSYGCLHVL